MGSQELQEKALLDGDGPLFFKLSKHCCRAMSLRRGGTALGGPAKMPAGMFNIWPMSQGRRRIWGATTLDSEAHFPSWKLMSLSSGGGI